MPDAALAEQLRRLLAGARPEAVPGGRLAWWGPTSFPDGETNAPVLTQAAWQFWYSRLEQSELRPGGLLPSPRILARLAGYRPNGVLPIAVVDVEVAVPRPEFTAAVLAAATGGTALPSPPARLADAVLPARCCMAAGLLHDQWGFAQPAYRGHTVTWVVEPDLWQGDSQSPPERVEVDAGDGRGPQMVAVGHPFEATYPGQDAAVVTVRVGAERSARFRVPLSDVPGAPAPDDMWVLSGPAHTGDHGRSTGQAFVYRAASHADIVHAVIIAEGFPGGFPWDYLYDVVNQNGMLEELRTRGFDVILLSFDQGTEPMQHNAGVVEACIREAWRRCAGPLTVGGMSMGGIITRYALAAMEHRGEDHHTELFLTIDTPHNGAYTSLAAQWFVHAFQRSSPALRSLAALLDSPANQQFVMTWVHDGTATESPLRTEWLRLLAEVGDFPRRPRKVAVSSGRGDGARSVPPCSSLMEWSGNSFAAASLKTLPEGSESTVAEGWCFPDPPAASLNVASQWSWDGAPGGQMPYNGIVAAIAASSGYGTVSHSADISVNVPTVSALALDQGPFEAVAASSRTPFDAVQFSAQNEIHLTLEPAVSTWLLAQIGTPSTAASNERELSGADLERS